MNNDATATDRMPPAIPIVQARWDPVIRHDSAMRKIVRALETARRHPDCEFTRDDLARVADLMGFKLKPRPSRELK